ncbi:hypothetical protein EYR36_009966 [Pleurotus pulmonarius]|nr:hypothetical protein EYR36_009966 [Pleurotus pulmonarius]KAF4593444.1 hypothetical protein EYR38_009158 [Pleurotus pulmonarius]
MDAPPINASNPASGEQCTPGPLPALTLAPRHIPRPFGVRWKPCDSYAGFRMLMQREKYDRPPPPPYIIPGYIRIPHTESWEQTSGLPPAAAIELGHEVALRKAQAKAKKTARRGKKGMHKGKPRKMKRSKLRHWFGVIWKESKSLKRKREDSVSADEKKALKQQGESDPAATESSAQTCLPCANPTPATGSDAEMAD